MKPRIETEIIIRSRAESGVKVKYVNVMLKTFQKVKIVMNTSSNNILKLFIIYEEKINFDDDEIFGADIPVMIPLPDDIISTGTFPQFKSSTWHLIIVEIVSLEHFGKKCKCDFEFPVCIKLYNIISLHKQFKVPILKTLLCSENRVSVLISLPITSVGPMDDFVLYVNAKTNSSSNKSKKNLKLVKIIFTIQEKIIFHDRSLPPRIIKIYSEEKNFDNKGDVNLDCDGISHSFQIKFPLMDMSIFSDDRELKKIFNNLNPDLNMNLSHLKLLHPKDVLANSNPITYSTFNNLDNEIPMTHSQSFTTSGKLFSLLHNINVKFKIHGTKDISINTPIYVSNYDRVYSKYLVSWIIEECGKTENRFGKSFIEKLNPPVNYSVLLDSLKPLKKKPKVYKALERGFQEKKNWFSDNSEVYID